MSGILPVQNSGFYNKQYSPIEDLAVKAEETIRRTNLQSTKTPAGAAAAALKYIATDAVKANIISPEPIKYPPGAKFLNANAAIKQYSKI